MTPLDRMPPHSIESEEAVLGSILIDPEALLRVRPFLTADDFYIVILGGGVSQSGRLLFDPLQEILRLSVMSPEYLSHLSITTAALGDEAGLLGALALVRTAQREVI